VGCQVAAKNYRPNAQSSREIQQLAIKPGMAVEVRSVEDVGVSRRRAPR
jgi:hypothetical protein